MELIGTIAGIDQDILTGKSKVIFEVEDIRRVAGQAGPLSGAKLRIELKKYRKKRSLDANAYYWQLLTKLAGVLKVSNSAMHNMLLRQYGELELFDGKIIYSYIPDTDEAENKALESDTFHLKPTSHIKIGKDGQAYRGYQLIRGSSTYDTKEMSRLIDGLVSACKDVGIETIPPEELKRMMEVYEKKHCSGR